MGMDEINQQEGCALAWEAPVIKVGRIIPETRAGRGNTGDFGHGRSGQSFWQWRGRRRS